MQLAHPLVARGVAQHSDFRERPVRRLYRTLTLTSRIAFATGERRRNAVRAINRAHASVRGPGYSALNPQLLLWVHATLVDSALSAYRTFVAPIPQADAEAFYQDSIEAGVALGIPRQLFPVDLAAFEHYVAAMLQNDAVPTAEAEELAASVLYPLRWLPRPLLAPINQVTAGLLPDGLRRSYGLPPAGLWFRLLRWCLPRLHRWLPGPIWQLPEARRARRA
ncbi:MAG: oxygenase MpaB family protein, partial [Candidatus Dormibacteraceae bacterium]